jgi:hypothetical protein
MRLTGGVRVYAFDTLSVESYGRIGEPAMQLLNTLASEVVRQWLGRQGRLVGISRELSVSLLRATVSSPCWPEGYQARCSERAFMMSD